MDNYKKEFSNDYAKKAVKLFSIWEQKNLTITYGKKESNVSDTYGLPYTSTSDYAMLGNTSVQAVYKDNTSYSFSHIAIDNYNNVIVILQNKNELDMPIVIGGINPPKTSDIKKFKNGNIELIYSELDSDNIDNFYEQMTNSDLYVQQIDGYQYLVDYNTSTVYNAFSSYLCSNVLLDLERQLLECNGRLKIYPMTKKDSEELFAIMDNEEDN